MSSAQPRPLLIPGETRVYPVLPLRDIVVFPHMIAPLFVGRKKSILALEKVMRSNTFILLATQKNASDDDPPTEAIYEIGTFASVLQLLKLRDAHRALNDPDTVPRRAVTSQNLIHSGKLGDSSRSLGAPERNGDIESVPTTERTA